ncbi:MAG: 1,6-anhydro-N-acetylmuramyl-L-alanine amidase AmpD [Gammaproteobacteria bacterium]|nr:1,6-anhydro-N-acetylmuramyl-L-alanine amidase AmpD [Gammaproteobacteria bacterium]
MQIDPETGLLDQARFIASPNFDERPGTGVPELIVVHNISLPPNQFGGPYIEQLFTNSLNPDEHAYFAEISHLHVSAHLLVRRDGSVIQFVPFHQRAWHAGQSNWCGRERCNDFSIGIELEGSDDVPYESVQYEQLAYIIKALRICYPSIDAHAITGHSDIAPGRKTDPGPSFSWERLKQLLA